MRKLLPFTLPSDASRISWCTLPRLTLLICMKTDWAYRFSALFPYLKGEADSTGMSYDISVYTVFLTLTPTTTTNSIVASSGYDVLVFQP